MNSEKMKEMLTGGDLRSIKDANKVVKLISNQDDFDILFELLYSNDRLIIMRTIDSIEKITRKEKKYLDNHKDEIIELCIKSFDKELKWHLAQIVPRLNLSSEEINKVFNILKTWTLDKRESRIVRANALESLFEFSRINKELKEEFDKIINQIRSENIPSLNARIKKILN